MWEAHVGDLCRGHPHIVQILDVFVKQSRVHLVLEHAGQSLHQRLKSDRLAHGDIRACLVAVLGGIGHLHDKGLVHTDVKPGNILAELGQDGSYLRFRLGDLGSTIEAHGIGVHKRAVRPFSG